MAQIYLYFYCNVFYCGDIFIQGLSSVKNESSCSQSWHLQIYCYFLFRYLEEAVMNLDLQDTVVQEHIKGVLYGLIQKLKLYIQAHPNDKMTKSLKMLLMASESLLK